MTPVLDAAAGPIDAAVFTQQYEALRSWMVDGPTGGTRPIGLALVLRRGLPAWLDGAALWLPAPARATPALTTSSDAAAALTAAPVVQALATMVERAREEGTP
jgi:hypothetical protein